jgi:hypothetical protein
MLMTLGKLVHPCTIVDTLAVTGLLTLCPLSRPLTRMKFPRAACLVTRLVAFACSLVHIFVRGR